MKLAAFQFRGSDNIRENLLALEHGIAEAARENVEFLFTQECALCGYPPIETREIARIDFEELESATSEIRKLAQESSLYVGLGTIHRIEDKYFNAVEVITPNGEKLAPYYKRALWGWDAENFIRGQDSGVYTIEGVRIGIRICYEVRFPEYFRELFKEKVEIALVSFCDVSPAEDVARYELLRSHLVTRAVENAMFLMSANSLSGTQTAPTCIINPDGVVLQSAPRDEECLLVFEFERDPSNFGREGRIKHSQELVGN